MDLVGPRKYGAIGGCGAAWRSQERKKSYMRGGVLEGEQGGESTAGRVIEAWFTVLFSLLTRTPL